jgi:glutamyl-tRNA reductase
MDGDAIQHLLEVAAGLDSMVIGEPQILGQVTEAYAAARKQGTIGKTLSRLFQTAIHTGKRARTETTINHNPASIASVAVNLISKVVPDLTTAKIMVLGAGTFRIWIS